MNTLRVAFETFTGKEAKIKLPVGAEIMCAQPGKFMNEIDVYYYYDGSIPPVYSDEKEFVAIEGNENICFGKDVEKNVEYINSLKLPGYGTLVHVFEVENA